MHEEGHHMNTTEYSRRIFNFLFRKGFVYKSYLFHQGSTNGRCERFYEWGTTITNLVWDLVFAFSEILFVPRCCCFFAGSLKKSLIHTGFSLYTLFLFDVTLPTGLEMTSVVALVARMLGTIEFRMDLHRSNVLEYWRAPPWSRRSLNGSGSCASKEDLHRQWASMASEYSGARRRII